MYPYRDDEYYPAYLEAYTYGAIDVSDFDVNDPTAATFAGVSGSGSNGLGGSMPDYTMTAEWAAAAANGVSCWDYPSGIPVWVPGPYGSNPTGTPSSGPQCFGNNAIPAAAPSPLPQATIQPLPTVTTRAPKDFSPSGLLNPLPQIVAGPKAAPMPVCNPFNQWVNDNPLLAAGVLALGFMWAMSGKKGRA